MRERSWYARPATAATGAGGVAAMELFTRDTAVAAPFSEKIGGRKLVVQPQVKWKIERVI
jgi:hypothetical protein